LFVVKRLGLFFSLERWQSPALRSHAAANLGQL
jgi:hypothetical protein